MALSSSPVLPDLDIALFPTAGEDRQLLPELRAVLGRAGTEGRLARLLCVGPGGNLRDASGVQGHRLSATGPAALALQRGELVSEGSGVAVPIYDRRQLCCVFVLTWPAGAADAWHRVRYAEDHASHIQHLVTAATDRVQSVRATALSLLRLLGQHHAETVRHSVQVATFARSLGAALRLDAADLLDLELVGLLHDLGKISVPVAILDKPGALDPEEWVCMRRHSAVSELLVSHHPQLAGLALPVRHHHERWDGRGYPDRLEAKSIPFFSRILAVADTYDAVVAGRPYQKPRSRETAIRILQEGAGTQFDPVCAEACDALEERCA